MHSLISHVAMCVALGACAAVSTAPLDMVQGRGLLAAAAVFAQRAAWLFVAVSLAFGVYGAVASDPERSLAVEATWLTSSDNSFDVGVASCLLAFGLASTVFARGAHGLSTRRRVALALTGWLAAAGAGITATVASAHGPGSLRSAAMLAALVLTPITLTAMGLITRGRLMARTGSIWTWANGMSIVAAGFGLLLGIGTVFLTVLGDSEPTSPTLVAADCTLAAAVLFAVVADQRAGRGTWRRPSIWAAVGPFAMLVLAIGRAEDVSRPEYLAGVGLTTVIAVVVVAIALAGGRSAMDERARGNGNH